MRNLNNKKEEIINGIKRSKKRVRERVYKEVKRKYIMNYFDIIGLYIRKNKWVNFFIDSVSILEDNDIVIDYSITVS